jgi:integrase
MHFTQTGVQAIKPNGKKQLIADDDTTGLKLYVGPTGVKVWYYYRRDANRKMTSRKLGPFPDLTLAEAREQARILGGEIAKGESIKKEKPPEILTLGVFLGTLFFPYIKTALKSHADMKRNMTFAFSGFFDKPIEEITPLLIEQWRMKRREEGKKASSVNRTMADLKSALNWGYKSGIIEKNPLQRLTPLKETDSKNIVRYLTPDERERLEAALIERDKRLQRESGKPQRGEFWDYLRPAVLLSLNTGIRQGALFALRWGDVDLDQQTITLRADDAKNGKTTRLPLSDDATDVLISWKAQSQDTGPGALIFPSPRTGEVMNDPRRAWDSLMKAAKIENFRWHDMRHDFASQLVMKGIDLNIVRELMCHSSMNMTMRYAHLAPESKLNAVQVLNRRVLGDKIIGRIRKTAS